MEQLSIFSSKFSVFFEKTLPFREIWARKHSKERLLEGPKKYIPITSFTLGASEKIWEKKTPWNRKFMIFHSPNFLKLKQNGEKSDPQIQHFLVKIHWKLRLAIWSTLGTFWTFTSQWSFKVLTTAGPSCSQKAVVTRRRCWVGNTNIANPVWKKNWSFSFPYSFKADFRSWFSKVDFLHKIQHVHVTWVGPLQKKCILCHCNQSPLFLKIKTVLENLKPVHWSTLESKTKHTLSQSCAIPSRTTQVRTHRRYKKKILVSFKTTFVEIPVDTVNIPLFTGFYTSHPTKPTNLVELKLHAYRLGSCFRLLLLGCNSPVLGFWSSITETRCKIASCSIENMWKTSWYWNPIHVFQQIWLVFSEWKHQVML